MLARTLARHEAQLASSTVPPLSTVGSLGRGWALGPPHLCLCMRPQLSGSSKGVVFHKIHQINRRTMLDPLQESCVRQPGALLPSCPKSRPPQATCRHLVLLHGPQVTAPACVAALERWLCRQHLARQQHPMWWHPPAGQQLLLLPLHWCLPPAGVVLDRKP
jgi:hypothetical protein